MPEPERLAVVVCRARQNDPPFLTPEKIERAIAIVENSRRTHVEWAEWQDSTPNWQAQVEPTSPGEPDHHRRCIADYDEVLAVLRYMLPPAPSGADESVPPPGTSGSGEAGQ